MEVAGNAGCRVGAGFMPFFRIFNPAGQAEKFDADGRYRRRFIAEMSKSPHPEALAYFQAVPRSWERAPERPYPKPVVDLAAAAAGALAAYGARNA